jgi:uncharacterized membrane protein YuzA (DUF378 family)
MKALHIIAFILLVVGGLNWGLVAFKFNAVEKIFGPATAPVTMIIYILVGLSALLELFTHKANCKCCATKSAAQTTM